MQFDWDRELVLLSVLVAVLGSYVSLSHALRMRASEGHAARLWMVAGGSTFGLTIWSMHFIGMMAMQLPVAVSFDVRLTVLSALPAVLAAMIGFTLLRRPVLGGRLLLVGGLLMGGGITTMHYLGMAAMRISPPPVYNGLIATLSALVAVGASAGALYIVYLSERKAWLHWVYQLLGATMMGLTVSAMHYIAMSGTSIAPGSIGLAATTPIDMHELALGVVSGVAVLLVSGFVASVFDQRLHLQSSEVMTKLHQTEQLLREMTDSLPVAVFRFEGRDLRTGRFVYVSRQVAQIFGIGAAELIEDPTAYFRLLPEADKAELVASIKRSFAQRTGWQHEFRIQLPGGEVRWIHGEVSAGVQTEDYFIWNGYWVDVTERHMREERMQNLLEFNPDGLIIVNEQGVITQVNGQAENLFDYRREELVGQKVDILMPEASRLMHADFMRDYFRDPRDTQMRNGRDVVGVLRDGEKIAIEVSLSPMETDNGLSVIASVRDVTRRKLAENKLRETETMLREMSDHLPGVVYQYISFGNGKGKYTFISRHVKDLFGVEPEDALKDGAVVEPALHEEDRESVIAAIVGSQRTGQPWVSEFRIRHPDGSIHWVKGRRCRCARWTWMV
ncbi:PAS domain S-box protein [Hydrogenophaga aquatica]